jgi:hypothetical protein
MGVCFEVKESDKFIERFKDFIDKSETMYDFNEESLHKSASDNIVKVLLSDISISQNNAKKSKTEANDV